MESEILFLALGFGAGACAGFLLGFPAGRADRRMPATRPHPLDYLYYPDSMEEPPLPPAPEPTDWSDIHQRQRENGEFKL